MSVTFERFGDVLFADPATRAVVEMAKRYAETELPVHICGSTGTGKELFARAIHEASPRRNRPFVAVNCAAIPEPLLESELFGYVKGAFTGATADRLGLFEAASGGTLFLDEIGDIPPAMAVKLLRVLQESAVRRVGGRGEVRFDVRIVTATHRRLDLEVARGAFREDVYYRLSVLLLDIPPLANRPKDIEVLAHAFVLAAGWLDHPSAAFTPSASRALREYPWPGNVRELKHAVERGLVMSQGDAIDVQHLGLRPWASVVPDPSFGSVALQRRPGRPRRLGYLSQALKELARGLTQYEVARCCGVSPAKLSRDLQLHRRGP